jgi:integrase
MVPRRHRAAGPATWNRELATLRAAVGWWRRRGWLNVDPTGDLERHREQVDRTRALTRGQLERLFARRDLALRERTLWRLLYETAVRANELLALDVEDLDLANRRARVHSKGGAVEWVFWQTGSAQLLPRLLAGRTSGPVFLGNRRPTRPVASLDLDETSGRARLSYRRAAELFHAETGWTLHQLRHSALTHAAEDGTNAVVGPLPTRLGALAGALRPPRTRGGRPPPGRDRSGAPPTVSHRTTSRCHTQVRCSGPDSVWMTKEFGSDRP